MTKKEQYWSEHLAAVSAENVTTKAYAEREGLSAASLYYWRKRLRQTTSGQSGTGRSTRSKLVPVQVAASSQQRLTCTLTLAPGIHLELAQLPEPQWLASLATASAGQLR